MTYAVALAALADPTRRQVFERLQHEGPSAVGELASALPVSRPAVSQHLKVLKEAGLVVDRAKGTRRVYYVDPHGLGALRKWLDQSWTQALAAFESELGTADAASTQHTKEPRDEPHDRCRARTQARARKRRARTRL
jgi:DNA-binding transcriptional ArsR family regulator